MAPHKALTLADILDEVFKHLSPTPAGDLGSFDSGSPMPLGDALTYKPRRLALARAARTCKAFAEPASRVLWGVQESLAPILSVLKAGHGASDDGQSLNWERFEHLARRIHALAVDPCGIGDDTLSLLCSHTASGQCALFPNLRMLFWTRGVATAPTWRPFHVALLKALCASQALALVSTMERDPTMLAAILAIVSAVCPELMHLRAAALSPANVDCRRALTSFGNLHSVQVASVDNELFRHLATLPNLRALHGNFTMSSAAVEVGTDVRAAFPALAELSTADTGEPPAFLPVVLPLISARSLTALSLEISVRLTKDALEYLSALCSSPALAQLRKLDLTVHFEFDPFADAHSASGDIRFADILPDLRRLRTLQDILVEVEFNRTMDASTFVINEDDLKDITSTWPDLARLALGISREREEQVWDEYGAGHISRKIVRPSLTAVVTVVEGCSKLKRVEGELFQ